ncbi:MAG: sigma-70 family RNA polymerase sigma factor [Pirellulaceae bacterium]|nr:sigma-70 family RNA polymerase sigma factor [Pirellulaceae bacterium]
MTTTYVNIQAPTQSANIVELTKSEDETLNEFRQGGEVALARFFATLRSELHRMLRFRIDQRLKRRLDGSDIIQEAYMESCHRLASYLENPQIPPSAWVRRLVRQVLSKTQREHLDTQRRDVRREFHGNVLVTSVDIGELSASMTPPDARVQMGEMREKLIGILSTMPMLESEILTLVHFESRTLREAAAELNINLEAAKKRYRRAILRLKGWISSESRIG